MLVCGDRPKNLIDDFRRGYCIERALLAFLVMVEDKKTFDIVCSSSGSTDSATYQGAKYAESTSFCAGSGEACHAR